MFQFGFTKKTYIYLDKGYCCHAWLLPEDADVLAPSCDVAGLGTPLALVGPTVLVAFGVVFDVADMLVCKDGDGPSSFLGKFMSVHKASLNQNNCSSIATNRLRTYEDFFINVQVWNQI